MGVAQNLSQRDQALTKLRRHGMLRLGELAAAGITAATIARMESDGAVVRLARGLYQLPDAPVDTHHTLAQVSKLVPKGIICLGSALAFHELTDHVPARVWVAIGVNDWKPKIQAPAMRFARYPKAQLAQGVRVHVIDGVKVPVFGIAKTLADLFRYRRITGINLAVEGLREALRQRKAKPAEIAKAAAAGGVWKIIEPYLMALTADG